MTEAILAERDAQDGLAGLSEPFSPDEMAASRAVSPCTSRTRTRTVDDRCLYGHPGSHKEPAQ